MMNIIKNIFSWVGIGLILVACIILCPEDNWYLPAVIGFFGVTLMILAILIERNQNAKGCVPKETKTIDVYIDGMHITMPAPLTDFEVVYLMTLRKDE